MIKIRLFGKNDTNEIIMLITSVVKEFLGWTDNESEDLIADLSDINKNYIDKGGAFFVGVINNKIIGTLALLPEKNKTVKLKRMYLNKEYSGKNFGSALLDFAENWCNSNNYNKIILSTYPPFYRFEFL
jgi:putative acetyltransferase